MAYRITRTIGVRGMTCTHCETILQEALAAVPGVLQAEALFRNSTVTVVFDSLQTRESDVYDAIRQAGYEVNPEMSAVSAQSQAGKTGKTGKACNAGKVDSKSTTGKDTDTGKTGKYAGQTVRSGLADGDRPFPIAAAGLLLVGLYLLADRLFGLTLVPQVESGMGYGMLFIVGLLTSVHCVAMCGGISLSQCLVRDAGTPAGSGWKPSLLYNAGRVLSYTLIGGIVGALGSVIRFPGAARGIVAIAAGAFMVLMGINMLGWIPALRRFQPHLPAGLRTRLLGTDGKRGPFMVGLINGLMPCGPLQAMQLYALGTGSALAGALSMGIFSLGTVPLMFGFGAVSTLLSKRFSRSLLRFSAILVMALGLIMMQRGFRLGGFGMPLPLPASQTGAFQGIPADAEGVTAREENGVQQIRGEVQTYAYPAITVKKGVPVEFILHADAQNLNGCNGAVIIPEFGLQLELQPGDNL